MTRRPSDCRIPLFVAAWTLALLVLPSPVEAGDGFERTQTCGSFGTQPCEPGEQPKPIFWPGRCVPYHVNEKGTDNFPRSGDGTIDENSRLYELVEESFDEWNNPSLLEQRDQQNCSDFTMVDQGVTSESKARYLQGDRRGENVNLVVWRDEEWPYSSRTTFALTSVTFTTDGTIRDADIEFNTDVYDFTHINAEGGGNRDKADLKNTLVHEIGHFLGLDHPNDPDTTMFKEANVGETKKRTLAAGDIRGLCATYPVQGDSRTTCDDQSDLVGSVPSRQRRRPGNGGVGCSTTPDAPPLPWLAVGVLCGLGLRSTRRTRR